MSNDIKKEFERAMIESGGAAQLESENPPAPEVAPVVEISIAQRMGLAPKQPERQMQTLEDRANQISKLHSQAPQSTDDLYRNGVDFEGPGSAFRRPGR